MHINSLPTDVLFAILKPYCEEEFYIDRHWKRSTNVLSVCQRWRQIALPITFNKIYISLSYELWTNIDIMTHGIKQYPRSVDIRIDSMVTSDMEYLENVLEKLKSIEGMLDNVVNLSLKFHIYGFFSDSEEEHPVPEMGFTEIARSLHALLPNISSLHSNMKSEDNILSAFETALLKLYAPQLTQVTVSPMVIDSDICFSKSLSKFAHGWAWNATVLPKINVDNLTKLELTGVDGSFDWSAFFNEKTNDSGVLHFPALELLSIGMLNHTTYRMDGHEEPNIPGGGFPYMLKVPRLLYLNVSVLCPLSCSLLASISTPRTLKRFFMADRYSIRFEFYGFSISDATKYVFEKYYNSSTTNKEAYGIEIANDLQAINGFKCSAIEAYIDQKISALEMQHIYWPQVTRLSVHNLIPLLDLLELIRSDLPNLLRLEAFHIKLSDMEDILSVIPEIQDGSIAPIETKVKTLVYGLGKRDKGVLDEEHRVFENLITKILRSLECVRLDKPL